MDNTLLDDLIRMIAAQGILGILRVIGAAVFALSWLVLPCVVCAVQRSTDHCSQELRALNKKMDLVMARRLFECKASQDVSPDETIHPPIMDGTAP